MTTIRQAESGEPPKQKTPDLGDQAFFEDKLGRELINKDSIAPSPSKSQLYWTEGKKIPLYWTESKKKPLYFIKGARIPLHWEAIC